MRYRGVVLLALLLSGCAGQSVSPTAQLPLLDCRQGGMLSADFTLQVRSVQRRGQRMIITAVVRNISNAPAPMSGETAATSIRFELVNAQGERFARDQQAMHKADAGVFSASRQLQMINPATTVGGKLEFDAPKGDYTLQLERDQSQQAAEKVPAICSLGVA
jgi:hypothetical protein